MTAVYIEYIRFYCASQHILAGKHSARWQSVVCRTRFNTESIELQFCFIFCLRSSRNIRATDEKKWHKQRCIRMCSRNEIKHGHGAHTERNCERWQLRHKLTVCLKQGACVRCEETATFAHGNATSSANSMDVSARCLYKLYLYPINTFQTADISSDGFVLVRLCTPYHIADEMRFPLDQFSCLRQQWQRQGRAKSAEQPREKGKQRASEQFAPLLTLRLLPSAPTI